MQFNFRRAAPPEIGDTDRRTRALRCESCHRIQGPLVYFLHRGHYCADCAPPIYDATNRRSSGRRSSDRQFPPYQSAHSN